MRSQTEDDSKHGKRDITDRRMSNADQIEFYKRCARLARKGLDTRRSPEFYDRQVKYFEMEQSQKL